MHGGAATFGSATVGTGKSVTVTGITLNGANAGNYTLASPSATTTATISAKVLTATVTAANKVFDGTTTATVTGCTLNGVVAGDVVTCAWGPATFDTAAVGTGKLVTVTGLTLGGAAAGNYTLASPTATTTAAITAAADATPPTVPGNLTATAAGGTQVTLAWTASTDNVAVTGYQVERCTGASCSTFVQVLTTSSAGGTDTGLTPATTYRYRVRATDAAGNLSGYSTVATVVMPSAPTITFVQARSATPGSSATTVSATFSGAQSAGNLNVVAIGWGDTLRTVVSVTDSRGNVYAPAVARTTTTGLSHDDLLREEHRECGGGQQHRDGDVQRGGVVPGCADAGIRRGGPDGAGGRNGERHGHGDGEHDGGGGDDERDGPAVCGQRGGDDDDRAGRGLHEPDDHGGRQHRGRPAGDGGRQLHRVGDAEQWRVGRATGRLPRGGGGGYDGADGAGRV